MNLGNHIIGEEEEKKGEQIVPKPILNQPSNNQNFSLVMPQDPRTSLRAP